MEPEDLRHIPAYVINLERRKDRKKHMQSVMKTLGVTKVTYMKAVDGKNLFMRHAGRCEKQTGKRKYKLTWTDKEQKCRVSQFQKLPNSKHAQLGWCVWSIVSISRFTRLSVCFAGTEDAGCVKSTYPAKCACSVHRSVKLGLLLLCFAHTSVSQRCDAGVRQVYFLALAAAMEVFVLVQAVGA